MKPNIVLLHSHDTGRHLGVYGAPVVTPHLQKLAQRGTLFRKAFCASPGCSASRSAMLTGLPSHECGMLGLAHRRFRLNNPELHLSHRLQEAGYFTKLIGFQHELPQEETDQLGYDEFTIDFSSDLPWESQGRAEIGAEWLRQDPPQPFFLNVALLETHRKGNDQVFAALEGAPSSNYQGSLPWLADSPENREDMAALSKAVSNVDEAVGVLETALQQSGLADNTVFIFTTDHGVPFPRAKATLYDAGIGVALVMAGPTIPKNRIDERMMSQLDLYPTWLEWVGLPTPTPIRGNSLLSHWSDSITEDEAIFAEITYHAAYDPARCIRTKRWKYIKSFADHPRYVWPNIDNSPSKSTLYDIDANRYGRPAEQLFDLISDPMEGENLISHPEAQTVLAELKKNLQDWMVETNDPLLQGPVPLPPDGFTTPVNDYGPDGGPRK